MSHWDEKLCCAKGASAPYPVGEDTSPTHRLLETKKWEFEGDIPQAGSGASQFAQRPHRALQHVAIAMLSAILLATTAHAAGSGMPWEAPLQRILESIEGPVAKIVAVIIIIVTGLTLAFGDMSGAFRRMVQVVFGLSIAFAATSFFLSFFAFAGGALID